MKFDKFVSKFITEAVKGQIAGYVEKQAKDINPATIIQDFISSKDPKFLLDAITFANDKMNVPIKMGKNSFAGQKFKAELKKELFEVFTPTKQTPIAPASNKFIVPVEDVEDPSTQEVKTSLMGSNAPNFFKRFYMQNANKKLNPASRDVWFKVLNLLYPEYERHSDIRQEGELGKGLTKKVKVEYINDKKQKTTTEITVRANDDTITSKPFSARPFFEQPHVHPLNADRDYKEFVSLVKANGGTIDAFVKAIKGKIVGERPI